MNMKHPKTLYVYFIVAVGISIAKNDNLCGLKTCQCKRHIHCDMPNGDLARICPKDTLAYTFNQDKKMKNIILDAHNVFRNRIAGGKIAPFPIAKRMRVLKWSDELGNLAARNVRQCKLKRDECSNTRDYDNVGQNLGMYTYSRKLQYDNNNLMSDLIGYWILEHKYCKKEYLEKWTNITDKIVRHFALIVNDRVSVIGCNAVKMSHKESMTYLAACYYNYDNVVGEAIYKQSTTPANGCERSSVYKNLCL